jgi:hypothetical protein
VVEFGETYYEFPTVANVGWINAVAWSPSGATLAFAGHDSSLVIVTFPPGDAEPIEQVPFIHAVHNHPPPVMQSSPNS